MRRRMASSFALELLAHSGQRRHFYSKAGRQTKANARIDVRSGRPA